MLLTLLLLAAAQKPPPAHVVVPKSMRERRETFAPDELPLPKTIFDDPAVAQALGDLKPQPGAWAEYGITTPGAGLLRARFSVLPSAQPERYWLEINSISESAPPTTVKLLLHGTKIAKENVERMFVYIIGQAPIELPADLQSPVEEKPEPPLHTGVKVKRLPDESVTVRAGTFEKCELYKAAGVRVWKSAKVPLWGLVKAQSQGQTVELSAYAREGAHTIFPEGWDDALPQGNGSDRTK